MAVKVEINKPVTFTDNSTGKDATTTYTWNFGDGSTQQTGVSAIHTYTTLGIYNITHTVKNSCNVNPVTCLSQQVEVVPVGQAGGGSSSIGIIIAAAAALAVGYIVMSGKK